MNQREWYNNLQFVALSMIANALLYALFSRFFLKSTGPQLLDLAMWVGLLIQVVVIMALRIWRRRRFNNQHYDAMGIFIGSVVGCGLSLLLWPYMGLPGLTIGTGLPLILYLLGHPVWQALVWNEVTLKGGTQKGRFRMILIATGLTCVFYGVGSSPQSGLGKDLMVTGTSFCLYMFIMGWVTSRQQIWLAFEDKIDEKSQHVITKDVNKFRHYATSKATTTRSANVATFVLILILVGASALVVGLFQFVSFQYQSHSMVTWIVDGIAFVLWKPLEWLNQMALYIKNLPGPGFAGGKFIPDFNVFRTLGLEEKIVMNYDAGDRKRVQEVLAMASQLLTGLVIIGSIGAAAFFGFWRTARIRPKLGSIMEGSLAVHEARNLFKDLMEAVIPKGLRHTEPVDPYRKQYKRLLEKAKLKGIEVEPMDTPESLSEKLIQRLPEEVNVILLITSVYNELRYGNEVPTQYAEALRAMGAFSKKINGLH